MSAESARASAEKRAVDEAVRLLREQGYLVVKIPACDKAGKGHGRHSLITRTANCEGEEPMPHGLRNVHQGTFAPWVNCACGHSFNDGPFDDGSPSEWQKHKEEHGV